MTKKIDRTVELVLRLESAARMSTGEEARDFKDAAHRLGTYAAACQGFSKDLADIAEAVGLSREECLEPPTVVEAVRKMAARRTREPDLGEAINRARAQNGVAMSVKRYDISPYYDGLCTNETADGDWVKYDDHAAEVARLREAASRYEPLLRLIRNRVPMHEDYQRDIDAALTARKDGAS